MRKLSLILALLLFSSHAYSAIALVQKKSATGDAASVAATLDDPSTTGNTIVVAVFSLRETLTSILDGTNTYTLATDTKINYAGGGYLSIYYCTNITGLATHTVTVTPDISSTVHIHILEFSGVLASSALDTSNSTFGASGTATTTDTVAETGSLVIGCAITYGGVTAGSGFTTGDETDYIGYKVHPEYKTDMASGTQTIDYTTTAFGWAMNWAVFKPTGAASTKRLMLLGAGK